MRERRRTAGAGGRRQNRQLWRARCCSCVLRSISAVGTRGGGPSSGGTAARRRAFIPCTASGRCRGRSSRRSGRRRVRRVRRGRDARASPAHPVPSAVARQGGSIRRECTHSSKRSGHRGRVCDTPKVRPRERQFSAVCQLQHERGPVRAGHGPHDEPEPASVVPCRDLNRLPNHLASLGVTAAGASVIVRATGTAALTAAANIPAASATRRCRSTSMTVLLSASGRRSALPLPARGCWGL